MDESPIDRIRRRRKELSDEITARQEELEALDTYLRVHEKFSGPPVRKVAGREIDGFCQMVLRDSEVPMTPAQILDALLERFQVEIDATNPARLVSTRMSILRSVESTEHGWRLISNGIQVENGVDQ